MKSAVTFHQAFITASVIISAAVLICHPGSAAEIICSTTDGNDSRLGAPVRSIVVVSRDHDGSRCAMSVGGYPAGGPSMWSLDNTFEDFRRSQDTGEGLIYMVLQRSPDGLPPQELANILLSAGGYGDSNDQVQHNFVVEFANTFLDDRQSCLFMIEGSGGFEPLDHGFCGYLRVDDDLSDSEVATALAETGITIPHRYYEGDSTFEYSYFVYSIDTGQAQIAAFFPTLR